jgi:uncharacterized delta-60 repeat protein
LNADGSIDQTFNPGAGASGIFSVAFRNAKIVIGGNFSDVNGESHLGVARLNLDGSVDSTFNGNGGNVAVAILSDNKVIVGGIGGYGPHSGVLRFLPNGEVDESFAIAVDRPFGQVYAVTVQPDDKTVFGGSFMTVNGQPRFRLARANADGTLDETFLPEGGSSFEVYAIAARGDGKIYQGSYMISRINSDGSIDQSFAWSRFNGGNGWVESVSVQQDGKPIVGGNFTSIENWETGQGTNWNYIVRLNNDGSIDESFGAGQSLANNTVVSVSAQLDGRILLGGFFTTVNGMPRSGIARLLGDAPLLTTKRTHDGRIVSSWPAAYTNHVLQTVSSVPSTKWLIVSNPPAVIGNMCVVTNPITSGNRFFRLAKP